MGGVGRRASERSFLELRSVGDDPAPYLLMAANLATASGPPGQLRRNSLLSPGRVESYIRGFFTSYLFLGRVTDPAV